jgi:glycosyltransferase involved in cell wall biosynthesis
VNPTQPPSDALARLVGEAHSLGVRRVHTFAWRDLDDPEAGGSEVHADEIFRRWAAAGLQITHRTSTIDRSRTFTRNGYGVVQRGGRLGVLLRTPWSGLRSSRRTADAVVDIWNGVPWWSPLWFRRRPTLVWLHHVHGPMWRQSFPRPMAAVGSFVERRLAPRVYRSQQMVTLAPSSAEHLYEIGFGRSNVAVVEPGVQSHWSAKPSARSASPLVVAVGRLAPVKRYVDLLEALAAARVAVPQLRVEIVGEGPDRPRMERWIADHGAEPWVTLRGRVDDDQLRDTYQRAWLVASASIAEGWAMVLTEAAACGTPAVATDVSGHRDSVRHNESGLLVGEPTQLADAVVAVCTDADLRSGLVDGALRRAAELSWDRAAERHLQLLVDVARHRRR